MPVVEKTRFLFWFKHFVMPDRILSPSSFVNVSVATYDKLYFLS